MKSFCLALCITLILYVNQAFGSETGMPQLNPEFWIAQAFWLILIFSILYLLIWKIFLPKITYSLESRKSRIGLTKTKLHLQLPSKNLKKRIELIPIKRMATTREIADYVFYLASERNSYITNQVSSISGGE